MLARSDPDPGSLKSWHQAASPVAMGRTSSACWASVACSSRVGRGQGGRQVRPTGGPMTLFARQHAGDGRGVAPRRPRTAQPTGQVG